MFDPHRTRRNDRRFYTRKGQVIQAKNLNSPFTIEQNKVDAYKEYIIRNRLLPPPPPSEIPIILTQVTLSSQREPIPFSTFQAFRGPTTVTFPEGRKLMIRIFKNLHYYNVNVSLTTDTSISVYGDEWLAWVFDNDIPSTDITFQTGTTDVFGIEVGLNGSFVDMEIYDSYFSIPSLPAHSE